MIKVLVVDDQTKVRAGTVAILNAAESIMVAGECSDGDQVSALTASVEPDVVVMDEVMPVMSGIQATRRLTAEQPTVRVLLFTGWLDPSTTRRAREAGAAGALRKGDPETLVRAVRTIAAGGMVWPA